MHLCLLVLQATAVYPESFIMLILFCIYRGSRVKALFSIFATQWFYLFIITWPDNKNKQWRHLFYLSLSQRLLLVVLLVYARHDEHKSKRLSQFLAVVLEYFLLDLFF